MLPRSITEREMDEAARYVYQCAILLPVTVTLTEGIVESLIAK